jgi:hypothetical protein
MSSSQAPIVDRIRIIPRPEDFLNRNVGSSGELFFNKATNSIRVYSGNDKGGFELAKTDFSNVDISTAIGSLDLTAQKNKLRFDWPTISELLFEVDPAQYQGMIAYVHQDEKIYFSNGTTWLPTANQSDVPTDINQLTDADGRIITNYSDLEGKPTSFDNLTSIGFTTGATINEFSTDNTFINSRDTVVPTESAVKAYVDNTLAAFDAGSGVSNAFVTLVSEDGSFDVGSSGELSVVGGIHISTQVVTDSEQLTIDLQPFGIEFLSNVSTNVPTTGEVLKWDGTQWAPAADVSSGGTGLDADTLDGFDSSYFLDYNNFTNTPSIITLSAISVGNEQAPAGNGGIEYNNTTGVFQYTPPDLSAYSTFDGAFSSLTGRPTTLAGYGITDAFDGDYSNLTNAPTDISQLTDTTELIPSGLLDLGITDGSNGQVLTTDGAGGFTFTSVSGVGGGEANQNAFSNVAISGQTTLAADTTTDTLTLIAGSGITLTTDETTDSVTIASNISTPSFSTLDEVTTASITVDKFYEHAYTTYYVDNNGATAYTFAPHYSGDNPTLFLLSGMTIAFDLNGISGHPFELQDSTGTALTTVDQLVHVSTTGVVSTGASAQGKDSGTLYWRIPETQTSPPNFRYQCQVHSNMVGAITVKDLSAL